MMNVKIFVLAHFGFPYQEKSEDIVTWLMQEEGVPRGLELENVAMDADYSKAIQLAIEPHKVNSAGTEVQIEKALFFLGKEDFLLRYVRETQNHNLCSIAR
ncbi:Hypothetical predicted protein [Olea europaea subsp. europaea]|uniref:Uncharacterized protein n=1 Tax=Olea europaea subsp. europaea TaxID=158383 RepID=A0A8S0VFZ1_OLEEU|nr:Hypothetical predicted protein [Olea europaea subsp. europaea]